MPLEAAQRGSEATSPDTTSHRRLDIQAVRALAVLSVVGYHFYPNRVPGGFVGVDIFFVISGFLITSHLIQRPPRNVSGFLQFWARRVLRLLPAAALVILVILGVVVAFVPSSQWRESVVHAISAMLYIENWRLIADATDYLEAGTAPTPFQHFWSLSVEEQYYIGAPFVVAALALVARRSGVAQAWRIFFGGLVILTLASFLYGLSLTWSAPSEAYFSSFARVWELGVGSVLAAANPAIQRVLGGRTNVRLALMSVGAAAVGVSIFALGHATPFPGYAALLPTVGTALLIAAADPAHIANPRGLTHSRPVQLTGDISYSLYLWHWPAIVLFPAVLGRRIEPWEGIPLFAATFVVAWASTVLLEDPVRSHPAFKNRTGRTFALGAALSAMVLVVGTAIAGWVSLTTARDAAAVEATRDAQALCFGAGAMDPSRDCPQDAELVTSPEFAKQDRPEGITTCLNWPPFGELVSCSRGVVENPTKKLALVGNSHAGQWQPALEKIASENGWQMDTYIIGACLPISVQNPDGTADGSPTCEELEEETTERLASEGYDGIVMAMFDEAEDSTEAQYSRLLDEWTAAGPDVLVIRDTPAPWTPENEMPDCIAANPGDFGACAGTPEEWIYPDLLFDAAAASDNPQISTVDLNPLMCTEDSCPAVIGGVIVLCDYNHLSATFAETLAPYLEPAVEEMLA